VCCCRFVQVTSRIQSLGLGWGAAALAILAGLAAFLPLSCLRGTWELCVLIMSMTSCTAKPFLTGQSPWSTAVFHRADAVWIPYRHKQAQRQQQQREQKHDVCQLHCIGHHTENVENLMLKACLLALCINVYMNTAVCWTAALPPTA
jgi:hypothetical protein